MKYFSIRPPAQRLCELASAAVLSTFFDQPFELSLPHHSDESHILHRLSYTISVSSLFFPDNEREPFVLASAGTISRRSPALRSYRNGDWNGGSGESPRGFGPGLNGFGVLDGFLDRFSLEGFLEHLGSVWKQVDEFLRARADWVTWMNPDLGWFVALLHP